MTTKDEVQPGVVVTERDEVITVQLHEKDLELLVQLLNLTNDLYKKVQENAVKSEDPGSQVLFEARSKLCTAFINKFNIYLDFAEPLSKEVH
jgi:hypothetical protein